MLTTWPLSALPNRDPNTGSQTRVFSVEVLASYSHSAQAVDLRICCTMALSNPVCPETEHEASVTPARPPR